MSDLDWARLSFMTGRTVGTYWAVFHLVAFDHISVTWVPRGSSHEGLSLLRRGCLKQVALLLSGIVNTTCKALPSVQELCTDFAGPWITAYIRGKVLTKLMHPELTMLLWKPCFDAGLFASYHLASNHPLFWGA